MALRAPAEQPPTLLAALGPKMLELSRTHADGAHPYWTTPEHTAEARAILGPDKLLCVEQKVVLTTDAAAARAAASGAVRVYAGLPNYRNNWLRLGFSDDEIEQRDSRFIDALVALGRCRHGAQPRPGTPRRGRGPRVHPTAVGRGLRSARLERARSARAVSQSTFTSVTRIDGL